MFVTVQWLVVLSSVEYSGVSKYSGLFYFCQLNIHVRHSTVACCTFKRGIFMFVTAQWLVLLSSVEYSCVSQYSGLFYFHQLNIRVCQNTVACLYFY